MRPAWTFSVISTVLFCCTGKIQPVKSHFDPRVQPPAPDYGMTAHWAALPDKRDAADSIPFNSGLTNQQAGARADVFFVYPTIYTGRPRKDFPWNADVNDTLLNKEIQQSTILNQASIFNGSCRVYAPYYRQAHLYAFYSPDANDKAKALELAYGDVKAAFQYYLQHFNHGRPLVIASHSQGSYHAARLISEFVDGRDLQKKLVAAYLVGRAIPQDAFSHISPSKHPDEVGVWASWNTFKRGFIPRTYDQYYQKALSVNPLLWNTSEDFASNELNAGGVGLNFTMVPHLADAQNHRNLLWINKPYVKGRGFVLTKIWHRADMNLFYTNIRDNVALRLEKYLQRFDSTTSTK
jgi:Protein of unknown function (DUF3089)